MKKLIINLAVILLVCSCFIKNNMSEVSCGHNKNVKLKDVDLNTFNCINSYYGKDKNSVYYLDIFPAKTKGYGKKIKNADPKTFTLDKFPRDKASVYYEGDKIKGADVSAFQILNKNYSKDKKYIYYMGKKIKDVDMSSFELLDDPENSGLYFRDKKNIYFSGKKLKKADALTFQFLSSGYTKDKENVYYRGVIYRKAGKRRYKADAETFKVLEKNYAKDKKNVYYGYYNKLLRSDPETFAVYKTEKKLDGKDYDAEDKNAYYYQGKVVERKK
jgi:hypothetical protein